MATWQSFDPFQALHREIENAFERAGPQFSPMFRSAFLPGRAAREYPLVNLYEEQDNVHVEALAPGAEPEFIQHQHGRKDAYDRRRKTAGTGGRKTRSVSP